MCLVSALQVAPNSSQIGKIIMTSQFLNMMSSSDFFDVVLFRLSSLAASPSFMTISLLALEL